MAGKPPVTVAVKKQQNTNAFHHNPNHSRTSNPLIEYQKLVYSCHQDGSFSLKVLNDTSVKLHNYLNFKSGTGKNILEPKIER